MKTIEQLERLFRLVGVAQPKQWAEFELDQDAGSLARVALLRALWQLVPAQGDARWLQRWTAYERDTQPAACAAYTRLVGAGANSEDLLALVRGIVSELVQQTVAVLDGGQPEYLEDEDARQIQWRLCVVNDDGRLRPLLGLHELTDGDALQEIKR